MFSLGKRIFSLLTKEERRKSAWLFVLILIMAVLEVVGIVSIMPFLAVVGDPTIIQTNKYLAWAYQSLGFQDDNGFLFAMGLVILGIIILNNGFTCFTVWKIYSYTFFQGHQLSVRLMEHYLGQPYPFFLKRNSAELSKNLMMEVTRVVEGVMIPYLLTIAKGVVSLFIISMLFITDPSLAVVVSLVLGAAYGGFYALIRRKLKFGGLETTRADSERFKTANEAFGGIQEIKLYGRTPEYKRRFTSASLAHAENKTTYKVLQQSPRYALETISFGGALLILLYLLQARQGMGEILPLIALYVFSGYKLMPALQQIYANLSTMRFSTASLDILHDDLISETETEFKTPEETSPLPSLPFSHEIRIESLGFSFPGASQPVLDQVNLDIQANTTVGLVGHTGCGKTTLVSLLMGLLTPAAGTLRVDGTALTSSNISQWQKNLGFVPQSIFLSDESIKHNIALGIAEDKIDFTAVERASRLANLHDFVSNDLPEGYDTVVGERGIRLSGGQRQRLGIARALYHDPKVLILDEATSSLDGITESIIMEAIQTLSHKKTIILIAHRLMTVKSCDIIYLLDGGSVVSQGTYSELFQNNPKFREMAQSL